MYISKNVAKHRINNSSAYVSPYTSSAIPYDNHIHNLNNLYSLVRFRRHISNDEKIQLIQVTDSAKNVHMITLHYQSTIRVFHSSYRASVFSDDLHVAAVCLPAQEKHPRLACTVLRSRPWIVRRVSLRVCEQLWGGAAVVSLHCNATRAPLRRAPASIREMFSTARVMP